MKESFPENLKFTSDNNSMFKIQAATYETRGPLDVCTFEIQNDNIQKIYQLGITSIVVLDNRTKRKINVKLSYPHIFSEQYACLIKS